MPSHNVLRVCDRKWNAVVSTYTPHVALARGGGRINAQATGTVLKGCDCEHSIAARAHLLARYAVVLVASESYVVELGPGAHRRSTSSHAPQNTRNRPETWLAVWEVPQHGSSIPGRHWPDPPARSALCPHSGRIVNRPFPQSAQGPSRCGSRPLCARPFPPHPLLALRFSPCTWQAAADRESWCCLCCLKRGLRRAESDVVGG